MMMNTTEENTSISRPTNRYYDDYDDHKADHSQSWEGKLVLSPTVRRRNVSATMKSIRKIMVGPETSKININISSHDSGHGDEDHAYDNGAVSSSPLLVENEDEDQDEGKEAIRNRKSILGANDDKNNARIRKKILTAITSGNNTDNRIIASDCDDNEATSNSLPTFFLTDEDKDEAVDGSQSSGKDVTDLISQITDLEAYIHKSPNLQHQDSREILKRLTQAKLCLLHEQESIPSSSDEESNEEEEEFDQVFAEHYYEICAIPNSDLRMFYPTDSSSLTISDEDETSDEYSEETVSSSSSSGEETESENEYVWTSNEYSSTEDDDNYFGSVDDDSFLCQTSSTTFSPPPRPSPPPEQQKMQIEQSENETENGGCRETDREIDNGSSEYDAEYTESKSGQSTEYDWTDEDEDEDGGWGFYYSTDFDSTLDQTSISTSLSHQQQQTSRTTGVSSCDEEKKKDGSIATSDDRGGEEGDSEDGISQDCGLLAAAMSYSGDRKNDKHIVSPSFEPWRKPTTVNSKEDRIPSSNQYNHDSENRSTSDTFADEETGKLNSSSTIEDTRVLRGEDSSGIRLFSIKLNKKTSRIILNASGCCFILIAIAIVIGVVLSGGGNGDEIMPSAQPTKQPTLTTIAPTNHPTKHATNNPTATATNSPSISTSFPSRATAAPESQPTALGDDSSTAMDGNEDEIILTPDYDTFVETSGEVSDTHNEQSDVLRVGDDNAILISYNISTTVSRIFPNKAGNAILQLSQLVINDDISNTTILRVSRLHDDTSPLLLGRNRRLEPVVTNDEYFMLGPTFEVISNETLVDVDVSALIFDQPQPEESTMQVYLYIEKSIETSIPNTEDLGHDDNDDDVIFHSSESNMPPLIIMRFMDANGNETISRLPSEFPSSQPHISSTPTPRPSSSMPSLATSSRPASAAPTRSSLPMTPSRLSSMSPSFAASTSIVSETTKPSTVTPSSSNPSRLPTHSP